MPKVPKSGHKILGNPGKSKNLKKAVFLDRDGTLNEDPGYLNDPSQLRLLPEVGEALSVLKEHGFVLVVVSNQSGVARGLIDKSALPKIHKKMNELLDPWSVKVDRFELCLHRPEDECDCRKPKPKLILDAARELGVDVSQSYMIGDKVSDIVAGQAAGCKGALLVLTGNGRVALAQLEENEPSFIGDSLLQAARWILNRENASF